MKLWKNRPLFSVASVWMGTSLAAFFLVSEVKCLLAVLCLAASLLLLTVLLIPTFRRTSRALSRWALCLCLLLGAALALIQSLLCIDLPERRVSELEGKTCTVEAIVTECRGSGNNMSAYLLSVTSVNGEPTAYDALLTCYYVADLRPGHTVTLTAEAISLSEAAGDLYEEYRLTSEGVFGGFLSLMETDYAITSDEPASPALRLAKSRYTLSLDMERLFGEAAAGLPSALLLGERDHIPDSTKRDFSRAGVSHLLAISGLHMTLLFGFLALLLKACHIPPRVRAVLLGAASIAYLAYLGFPPSATRAVVMLGMTYLASLCFASADPLTSLGVAGMGILLFSPTAVADVGFWMSFSATLGLLTILPVIQAPTGDRQGKCGRFAGLWRKPCGKLWSGLAAGIAAVTFSLWVTTPIIGEMSLLSAPMTLLLTPLVGVLLLLVPAAMLLSASPVGPWLTEAVRLISSLINRACELCASPSWTVVSLRHPAVPYMAIAMVLLTLLLLGLSLKRKGVILLPMVTGWVVIGLILGIHAVNTDNDLQVTHLVPSTTSEMLVMTRGHEGVICEMSNGSRRSFLAAAEEASRRGATELSAVIVTDYHTRTSGALLKLMGRETVRALWLPKPTCENDYYLMIACLEAAQRTDTPTVIYDHGEDLTLFGTATLTVERTEIKRSVQPVLLLTLETPAEQAVICGRSILESDLSPAALAAIAESERVIFSNKGPVLKQAMDCAFDPRVCAVSFADKSVAAYLSPSCYPGDGVAVTVGQTRFNVSLSP